MTMFCMGITAAQTQSSFSQKYRAGIHKTKYWDAVFDDCLNVIAKSGRIAAIIYNKLYRDSIPTPQPDDNLDFGGNFANQIGFNTEAQAELLRLYFTLHMDHEGGNVSAHATRLVGSALSDPYLSFAAGMAGLAGPLHGLANQECLRWLLNFREKYGENWTNKDLKGHVWDTLNSGAVIPGFGHAVLRQTDPRFTIQLEFGEKHFPNEDLVKLVRAAYETIPGELEKTGKIQNPWPNVDAGSGALLYSNGLTQSDYYTVLFGVSRAFGVCSALLWDRALGLPIERPGSMTLSNLEEWAAEN